MASGLSFGFFAASAWAAIADPAHSKTNPKTRETRIDWMNGSRAMW
jgi:hypothetical protein